MACPITEEDCSTLVVPDACGIPTVEVFYTIPVKECYKDLVTPPVPIYFDICLEEDE